MKQTVPHDLAAEQYVLGSLLLHPDLIDEWGELTDEYFFVPAHRRVLGAVRAVRSGGGTPDLLTVTQRMTADKTLEEIGGPGALTDLYCKGTGRVIDYQVNVLRGHMARRRILEAGARMVEGAKDLGREPEDVLAEAGESILSVDMAGKQDGASAAASIVHSVMDDFERAMKERGKPRGLATGYRDFDYITGGLRPGQLVLVAARPAMGKSALLLNIADRLAARNVPCLLYSLEMMKDDLIRRIVCSRARVSSTKARMGAINGDEAKRLGMESMRLGSEPLYIDDSEGVNIMDLRARARREARLNKVQCILIDYVQLIKARGQNRENEVSEVSRGLKAMAKELGVPVIAAAQVNRAVESRGDCRPKMSDLRESGSLEQDADIVTLLFRPGYYEAGADNGAGVQEAEWIVAKHREGKTGPIPLIWHPEFTRFDTAQIHKLTDEAAQPYAPSPQLLEAINE